MEQILNKNQNRTIYCHFSFKRPKNKDYGIFAVAFYNDFDGKKIITKAVRKFPLWQDHQFITAIQAYEHALYTIYNWQGVMLKNHITTIMLVTDNSTLAGWIENPKKNKAYTEYMNKAVEKYRAGGPKEIRLSIGLCEVRDYEKSYKFCKEENVINDVVPVAVKENGKRVIDLESSGMTYNTITAEIKNSPITVEIDGMQES